MSYTSVEIRFNKLRDKLPHRYAKPIAKEAGDVTPVQVKLVFLGRIKDPHLVEHVYKASKKVAAMYQKTTRLTARRKRRA
jgi:hypothetical protein